MALRRYRELFESGPDSHLVTDANGKILEANHAAAELRQALHGPQHVVVVDADDDDVVRVVGDGRRDRAARQPEAADEPDAGAAGAEVPLDDRHRHDLDAMLREITAATRLVIVCNPNNPTSTALPLGEIAKFIRAVPRHIAVILDEAYCEFNLLQDPDE